MRQYELMCTEVLIHDKAWEIIRALLSTAVGLIVCRISCRCMKLLPKSKFILLYIVSKYQKDLSKNAEVIRFLLARKI